MGGREARALRYFADESVGYSYPEACIAYFGPDYCPPAYIRRQIMSVASTLIQWDGVVPTQAADILAFYQMHWDNDILLGCILPWREEALSLIPDATAKTLAMDARGTSCFVTATGLWRISRSRSRRGTTDRVPTIKRNMKWSARRFILGPPGSPRRRIEGI